MSTLVFDATIKAETLDNPEGFYPWSIAYNWRMLGNSLHIPPRCPGEYDTVILDITSPCLIGGPDEVVSCSDISIRENFRGTINVKELTVYGCFISESDTAFLSSGTTVCMSGTGVSTLGGSPESYPEFELPIPKFRID